MRLKQKEIDAIKEITRAVFGTQATVMLFGSRTDDIKRGGDIDLYIQCNHTISDTEQYRLKIKFLVRLKEIIGDQKIDVLINSGQQTNSIYTSVKKQGILL